MRRLVAARAGADIEEDIAPSFGITGQRAFADRTRASSMSRALALSS